MSSETGESMNSQYFSKSKALIIYLLPTDWQSLIYTD